MASIPKGLNFQHSSNIDPLRRKCSIATIQSDPEGHFATVINEIKEIGNYQNVLLEVSKLQGDNLELLKYVANLEGMGKFGPKPIHRTKDLKYAEEQRAEGNAAFKKGDFKKAYGHYSHAVLKAPYPDQGSSEPVSNAGLFS